MYKGKHTCEILKSIRKQIADVNEIPYEPVVCTHEGDCRGTCPACESEMRYIENQLNIRKMAGKAVKIIGLGMNLVQHNKPGKRGTVIVEFVVERNGGISDIKVLQGVDPIVDRMAINIIQKMDKLKPAINRDSLPYRSRYRIPISFELD